MTPRLPTFTVAPRPPIDTLVKPRFPTLSRKPGAILIDLRKRHPMRSPHSEASICRIAVQGPLDIVQRLRLTASFSMSPFLSTKVSWRSAMAHAGARFRGVANIFLQ